jgi:hypothetical protein
MVVMKGAAWLIHLSLLPGLDPVSAIATLQGSRAEGLLKGHGTFKRWGLVGGP